MSVNVLCHTAARAAERRWRELILRSLHAQQIVFEELIQAIEQAIARRGRLEQQMVALLPNWSLHSVVTALQVLAASPSLPRSFSPPRSATSVALPTPGS